MQFGSKVYRHLKLCSRMQTAENRDEYIEMHRVKILKHSLPSELFDLLERKESLYHSFTSTEIMDHYISFQHNQEQNKYNTHQYHVYNVNGIGIGGGTFRKVSNSKMGNGKKIQFRRFERKDNQVEEKPSKNVKEINQKSVEGTERKSINKPVWYKNKLDILAKAGVSSNKIICFACMLSLSYL